MKKQKLPKTHPIPEPNTETKELKTITNHILTKIGAEKIICFGSIIKNTQNKSCFVPEKKDIELLQQNSYYLLVIPPAGESRADIVIQQRLEEDLKAIASVTIIVHRMEEINTALQNGSSFFTTIYKKGTLLHDHETEPFVVPAPGAPISKRIIKRENFWHQWFNLSEGFLKGACFYSADNNNNLAMFMLHQALQHCYSGMLRVLTGYRSNANSLRRLLRLIENILPESSFTSAKNTPEDARLTGLLLKGFSDARYNDKFEVTYQEVQVLIGRIETILLNANIACLEHLKNIKQGKTPYIA